MKIRLDERQPPLKLWTVLYNGNQDAIKIVVRIQGTTVTLRPYKTFKYKFVQRLYFTYLKVMVWLKIY